MKALFSALILSAAASFLGAPADAQAVRPSYSSHESRPSYDSSRVWIPGRVETVLERFWVPARWERVWVEPVWELRRDFCGRPVRVLVCAGNWKSVYHPGHYETRSVCRPVPGRWVARGSRH